MNYLGVFMLAITIISLFVLLVIVIVVIEMKNEKAYQEKRRQKRQNTKEISRKKSFKSENVSLKKEKKASQKIVVTSKKDEKTQVEKVSPAKELPKCNYPKFSHVRLVDMGLSDKEAREFVQELIPQIEVQIPLIEEVLDTPNLQQMERLTHSIKGSATNLGTGGISDLLVEYNTYLKEGRDIDIVKVYFEYLKHYTQELKKQYS